MTSGDKIPRREAQEASNERTSLCQLSGNSASHNSWFDRACQLAGLQLPAGVRQTGSHKDDFNVTFLQDPNPDPGEEHSDGDCNEECKPKLGTSCRINGIITIENASSHDVTVNWRGSQGGTPIPSGESGQFNVCSSAPCPTIHCAGPNKIIELTASGSGVIASIQWVCNPCAVPVGD